MVPRNTSSLPAAGGAAGTFSLGSLGAESAGPTAVFLFPRPVADHQ